MYFEIPDTNVRVLGSMHMIPSGAEAVPAWAQAAYDWCEDMVIESDPPSLLKFARTDSPTLQMQLKPRVWAAVQNAWPAVGPLTPLEQVRPWAALLFFNAMRIGSKAIQGIESNLLQQAATDAKSVAYLESGEGLARLFDAIPLDEIHASFDVVLDDEPALLRGFIAMHEAWLQRDRSKLHAVACTLPLFSYPAIRYAMLDARNRAWAREIERMLASSRRTLIVVGTLHLCGPGNVEQCLEREFRPVADTAVDGRLQS